MKPSTAVTVTQLDKIHGPVVFVCPVVVFDAAYGDIHENDAAGPQYWRHAAVRQTDIPIPLAGIAIGQQAFEVAPLLDHAGEQFSPLGIERRIESQGSFERYGRSREVSMRGMKGPTVGETIFDGNIVPTENLERVQVIDNRECIKLMKTRSDAAVFDVGQAADVKNQLGAAAARCQFKTCAFDVAIG